jgi:hypothetical protein
VAAVAAAVFVVPGAAFHVGHAVPSRHAHQRVADAPPAAPRQQERVAAAAGVFGEPLPGADHVHGVAGEPAEVAHLLPERSRVSVGVGAALEQERVPTTDAHVFVVAVPRPGGRVGVMPEEAGERVPDAGGGSVFGQVRRSARVAAPRPGRAREPPVVDRVAEHRARQPLPSHDPKVGTPGAAVPNDRQNISKARWAEVCVDLGGSLGPPRHPSAMALALPPNPPRACRRATRAAVPGSMAVDGRHLLKPIDGSVRLSERRFP